MHLTGLYGTGTAAVAADDDRVLQLAGGNHLTDPAADTGGLGLHDDALLHIIRKYILCGTQRCCCHMEILETHLLHQHLGHHAGHIVAVTEFCMEGKGHAVMGAALLAGLTDGRTELVLLRLLMTYCGGAGLLHQLTVSVILTLIYLPAIDEQVIRNVSANCIDHGFVSFLTL